VLETIDEVSRIEKNLTEAVEWVAKGLGKAKQISLDLSSTTAQLSNITTTLSNAFQQTHHDIAKNLLKVNEAIVMGGEGVAVMMEMVEEVVKQLVEIVGVV